MPGLTSALGGSCRNFLPAHKASDKSLPILAHLCHEVGSSPEICPGVHIDSHYSGAGLIEVGMKVLTSCCLNPEFLCPRYTGPYVLPVSISLLPQWAAWGVAPEPSSRPPNLVDEKGQGFHPASFRPGLEVAHGTSWHSQHRQPWGAEERAPLGRREKERAPLGRREKEVFPLPLWTPLRCFRGIGGWLGSRGQR